MAGSNSAERSLLRLGQEFDCSEGEGDSKESSGHTVWMSEELSSQMVSAFSSLLIPKLVSKNSKIV